MSVKCKTSSQATLCKFLWIRFYKKNIHCATVGIFKVHLSTALINFHTSKAFSANRYFETHVWCCNTHLWLHRGSSPKDVPAFPVSSSFTSRGDLCMFSPTFIPTMQCWYLARLSEILIQNVVLLTASLNFFLRIVRSHKFCLWRFLGIPLQESR